MSLFGWDYPPGVTGNEYEIAGADYSTESDTPCPYEPQRGIEDSLPCGEPTMEEGYQGKRWLACDEGHTTDLEPKEDDPDRLYDEARDREAEDFDPMDTDLSNDETAMLGQPY